MKQLEILKSTQKTAKLLDDGNTAVFVRKWLEAYQWLRFQISFTKAFLLSFDEFSGPVSNSTSRYSPSNSKLTSADMPSFCLKPVSKWSLWENAYLQDYSHLLDNKSGNTVPMKFCLSDCWNKEKPAWKQNLLILSLETTDLVNYEKTCERGCNDLNFFLRFSNV